ncbi:MAG: penicillin-binding protein 1C [Alphaproteobacteria bacterium]|nr:MAG: penicillin-binding protein 1C [Alphaproteobacteria bacterium]
MFACLIALALSVLALDRLLPPDMARYQTLSQEVLDSKGRPLRIYLAGDGTYRLPVTAGEVDPRYLAMLIAFEDKRFYAHGGVDTLALGRATLQMISNGRVVSGASTLTMQTARLLEPRPRTLRAKLIEMARAWQLERRYAKDEILSIYLTLAPFGGNIEGVRAASNHFYGTPPSGLTLGKAALLVALPQAPSSLRPDRYPARARQARDKVIDRVAAALGLPEDEIALAKREDIAYAPHDNPFVAPHFADYAIAQMPNSQVLHTTLDGDLQTHVQNLARAAASKPGESAAALVIDNRTRQILAWVGSADFRDFSSAGQVDMVTAVRSPGSTLKPAIYGFAFERGIAHPATLVLDAPTQFGDYAPSNFMDRHYGEVTLGAALRQSLNVPAVAVLNELGPVSVSQGLIRAGVDLDFGGAEAEPGLAFALGGVGTTLADLVALYAALADDGAVAEPVWAAGGEAVKGDPLFSARTRWYLTQVLTAVPPPSSLVPDRYRQNASGIAFKTGTSYGFRDAWAIGYNGDVTIGVWVGRPDGTPSPGQFGANTAAPFLFAIFDRLPKRPAGLGPRPDNALPMVPDALPIGLRHLGNKDLQVALDQKAPPPRITFPLNDTDVLLPPEGRPLRLKAEGGARPYTWVVDGKPLARDDAYQTADWRPRGLGFSDVTVIDANGAKATVSIRVVGE